MAIKTIPKNNDGGWYYDTPAKVAALVKSIGLQPGDTIEMSGDYAYINMNGLITAVGLPRIIFKPKGVVRVGVKNSYAWIMQNCKGFNILGDYLGANKFIIGGLEGQFIAQSLTFTGSDECEFDGLELCNAQVGFHQNRKETGGEWPMRNIKITNSYVHTLANPSEGGRAEGFYLGNTDKAFYQKGAWMDNVIIENNLIDGVSGDGIQIAKATNLKILNNTVKNYGGANLENQNTGIIVGGCSSGIVQGNDILDGKGSAIQVFGAGEVIIENNTILRTSTNSINDGIYIDGKCSDGPALKVRLKGNSIDDAGRDLVRDVKGNAIIENVNNSWNPKPPEPEPEPEKKLLYTVTTKVFEGAAPETTTVAAIK
jgi:hypothetical protein